MTWWNISLENNLVVKSAFLDCIIEGGWSSVLGVILSSGGKLVFHARISVVFQFSLGLSSRVEIWLEYRKLLILPVWAFLKYWTIRGAELELSSICKFMICISLGTCKCGSVHIRFHVVSNKFGKNRCNWWQMTYKCYVWEIEGFSACFEKRVHWARVCWFRFGLLS